MAKFMDSIQPGFNVVDLMNENGVFFEIGDNYEEAEEEFGYTPHVQFTNEEMLEMLNMNEFEDEEEQSDSNDIVIWGISFDKIRTKMTPVTEDGKVMKYIKQEGIGEVVPPNYGVTIHYLGYFEYNDEPFDSTYINGKPRMVRLEQHCLIPGLELGILSMKKHEKAMFLIHPDLAYKTLGCPPRIPPNAEVIFIVHLIEILDTASADTYENLSKEEKRSFEYVSQSVKRILASAKDNFAKFNIKRAAREYRRVVDSLEEVKLKNVEEETKINSLLSQACTNLAICYNKLDQPRSACASCDKTPTPTAKTYFHHGKALLNLGEYEMAMKKLTTARSLQPQSDDIRKLIQETNAKQREYQEIQKRLWANCFKAEKEKGVKVCEFRQAARELCESIINHSSVTRQVLPEGFREEEMAIIRDEAALLGLDVVTLVRFGKEQIYLQKSKSLTN